MKPRSQPRGQKREPSMVEGRDILRFHQDMERIARLKRVEAAWLNFARKVVGKSKKKR